MASHGPLGALFHDSGEAAAPADEIAWYEARLPRDAGPVLAPMCGSGRLLVPLTAAGLNVHGVDASASMLAHCEARLAGRSDGARLFRQDVAELNLPFRYAAAFIAAGAFQRIVDPARARAALVRLRSHLVGPQLLLLDLFVPGEGEQRIAAPLVEVRSVALADGTRIAQRSETTMSADAHLAHTASRYVHRRGNDLLAEESETTALTWYAPDDITALVEAAGYRSVEIAASPRRVVDGMAFSLRAAA
ncbi:MAG TPA: class I SAM-dependent methyltransferase [Casimicrobiaceae bacterium]|nr:class I SAM-dependent methyltransferase [Casimicrobiaceae bacterium]